MTLWAAASFYSENITDTRQSLDEFGPDTTLLAEIFSIILWPLFFMKTDDTNT